MARRHRSPADDESGRGLLDAVRDGQPVTIPCRLVGMVDGRRVDAPGRLRLGVDGVQWRHGDTWVEVPPALSGLEVTQGPESTGALVVALEGSDTELQLQPHHVDGVLAALGRRDGVAPPLAPLVGTLWPLADQVRTHRWAGAVVSWVVAGAVVALAAVGGGDAGSALSLDGPTASLAQRRCRAQGRYRIHEPALVWGDAPWCPRYPDRSTLTLSAGDVELRQGHPRSVPMAELRVVSARPAGGVATPVKVPRSWWVLELTSTSGEAAFCAAHPATLALLGAVASWPVPPGWQTPQPVPAR